MLLVSQQRLITEFCQHARFCNRGVCRTCGMGATNPYAKHGTNHPFDDSGCTCGRDALVAAATTLSDHDIDAILDGLTFAENEGVALGTVDNRELAEKLRAAKESA